MGRISMMKCNTCKVYSSEEISYSLYSGKFNLKRENGEFLLLNRREDTDDLKSAKNIYYCFICQDVEAVYAD